MIILACETATLLGSVAVFKNNQLLACRESMRQGSHSDALNTFISEVLTEAQITLNDVDLYATGVGPGSFTGIRISLNTIKTLAYCHNKKVYGLDSLENLALGVSVGTDLPIVAMINAYKNMVYIATFERLNQTLVVTRPPEVVRVQNLQQYFERKSIVVGDGYLAYEKYFSEDLKQKMERLVLNLDEPHAKNLAQSAFFNAEKTYTWNELKPVYLRASEAEENIKGIKYQPLF